MFFVGRSKKGSDAFYAFFMGQKSIYIAYHRFFSPLENSLRVIFFFETEAYFWYFTWICFIHLGRNSIENMFFLHKRLRNIMIFGSFFHFVYQWTLTNLYFLYFFLVICLTGLVWEKMVCSISSLVWGLCHLKFISRLAECFYWFFLVPPLITFVLMHS